MATEAHPQSVAILGAGLAGLSAAHHLGQGEVFEKDGYVGGHSRTKHVGGFNFDEGAHVFFGTDECADMFVRVPLAGELNHHVAEIWNHYEKRTFGPYPVQANASAIDPELATLCVLDFIEASKHTPRDVTNYKEWCYESFGRAFADNFMLRYARKVWTVEPEELTTEWLGSKVGGRISRPSIDQVVRGAIDSRPQVLNYLTHFSYPSHGGFGRIVEPLATTVSGVRLNNGVVRIDSRARRLYLSDGSECSYDAVISTVPLPAFVAMVVDAPEVVRLAAQRLMWTSLSCVNLGIEQAEVGPGHWIYFYDENIPFFRVSFPSKFASTNAPEGYSSIQCEIAHSRRKPLDKANLTTRVLDALRDVGILKSATRVIVQDHMDVPYAYVVYDFNRAASVATIHSWMLSMGIYPCGRFGEWGYHWTFEAIDSGRRVARMVAAALGVTPRVP